jgi:hypothetical protein
MNRASFTLSGFKAVILLASLLVCIAVILAFFEDSTPAPFVLLHQPFSKPLLVRDRLVQWIPTASPWTWIPHLEDLLFGRRKPVNLYSDIVEIPHTVADGLSSQPRSNLGPPSFSTTNGLQIWVLDGRELKSLRDYLKNSGDAHFLSHPRISTADGVEASMFVGESVLLYGTTNSVGLKAAFFPRARKACTDLFAMISFTDLATNQDGLKTAGTVSIRTNLDIAARLQVPLGSGLFLLDGKSVSAEHTRFGVLIEPP